LLNRYLTVKSRGEHEIVIEKSRFICHIQHNCSAYLIGEQDQIQKANDDGEPSGTAGVPMLEVLKKRKLKDTVVVVTRYFGGIKLGAGGLSRAYGKSVSEAINHVGMVERCLMRTMHTTIDYTWLGKVENELRASSFQLKDIHYAEDVIFETYVEETQTEQFIEWMTELTNGKSVTKEGELIYLEKDVGPIKETDEWHNE